MFDREVFDIERASLIGNLSENSILQREALTFVNNSNLVKYAYVWNWMGLPVIQMPEDLIKVQEIIFETKPDVVIETGVAWGGSLAFYGSVLKSIGHGRVIGIDITIPEQNAKRILESNSGDLITLIEGSSIEEEVFTKVSELIPENSKVLLVLDSHHTHEHVLKELQLWSKLVMKGSYIVVCDTIVEFIESPSDRVRPWGKGNNPFTAVQEFLTLSSRFSSENEYNSKSLTTFHPGGFLIATN
jgi:cephalosporin hydroxylase